jgi:riboflavin-specific deaminase-like protein
VTLCYAQSLDGSITTRRGVPLSLSGRESIKLWHRLRVYHDVILVGIGTVLADDPQLNVRLVSGTDPQPVVLDAKLGFPLKALALDGRKSPWIITTQASDPKKRYILESKGARVVSMKATSKGWVNLHTLLRFLAQEKMNSIMVEGGARVITSFLKEQLADYFVITITPVFLGGLHAVDTLLPNTNYDAGKYLKRVKVLGHKRYGPDLVVWGTFRRNK